eukprot:sb/3474075/
MDSVLEVSRDFAVLGSVRVSARLGQDSGSEYYSPQVSPFQPTCSLPEVPLADFVAVPHEVVAVPLEIVPFVPHVEPYLHFERPHSLFGDQEPTETSKQPIRALYLGHVTGYLPIMDHYFLFRSVPGLLIKHSKRNSGHNDAT